MAEYRFPPQPNLRFEIFVSVLKKMHNLDVIRHLNSHNVQMVLTAVVLLAASAAQARLTQHFVLQLCSLPLEIISSFEHGV